MAEAPMKLVVIGGVAGGMSAAARARRLNETASIIVFEKGPDPSFANCGMPYYLGGEIKDRNALNVQTPKSLKDRLEIDVRTRTEVIKINCAAKTVTARNLSDGKEYDQPYDHLILSLGASPFRPPIPGSCQFMLWNLSIFSSSLMVVRNRYRQAG
jgi:NADPH-dependent 2,4-dienoyl-CoA reductase/sulfur reductase-like enzyme